MRLGKYIIRTADGIVNVTMSVFFLILLAYAVFALWDSNHLYQQADASVYEMYKPTQKDPEALKELMLINPDIIGWLTIPGTHIDYPLAQGEDNVMYVNRDAKGEYSQSGCLFLDCQNAVDFSDFNSIIYGHQENDVRRFRFI